MTHTSAQLPELENSSIPPQQIGAFFDIDETLVRGATTFWAAKEMFVRKFFHFTDIQYAGRQTFRFMLFGENAKKIDNLTRRAAQAVAGNSIMELEEIGEQIFERYFLPRSYKATYERLQAHLAAGNQVWLISATPWIIAEVFARRLGATGGVGTKAKVSGDLILGEIDGRILHGAEKVEAVLAIAKTESLDLTHSWAYSDSVNDIPMLSAVGHPVAVNPDRKLAQHARAHGWSILQARGSRDNLQRRAIKLGLAAGAGVGIWLTIRGIRGLIR